jgi:non-specific protein-tyrosine kinase
MELKGYMQLLGRRGVAILATTGVTLALVIAIGLLIPPVYVADAKVRVLLDVGVSDFLLREDYTERLLNTYAEILTSEPILEEAIQRLGLRAATLPINTLRQRISTQVVPDTELIQIAVEAGNPQLAQGLADTLAGLLAEYAEELYVGSSKSTRQILEEQLASLEVELVESRQQLTALLAEGATAEVEALTHQIESKEEAYDRLLDRLELAQLNAALRANSVVVIEPAALPSGPSNSLGLTQIALGLAVGLCGGIGVALVLENLDTRFHNSQQLETHTDLPVLGSVPKGLLPVNDAGDPPPGAGIQPMEEAYRLLGINLLSMKRQTLEESGKPIRVVLITSSVAEEGKSMVASNLARTLAEQGQRVFLVESDLRRPSIARHLALEKSLGLAELLSQDGTEVELNPDEMPHLPQWPSLSVISGADAVARPTALLASPRMEELLNHLGEVGDLILLDAPPVLGMADVSVLAPRVDGVLLVARQSFSRREQVRAALKQLRTSRTHVLGAVFVEKDARKWNYYGYD